MLIGRLQGTEPGDEKGQRENWVLWWKQFIGGKSGVNSQLLKTTLGLQSLLQSFERKTLRFLSHCFEVTLKTNNFKKAEDRCYSDSEIENVPKVTGLKRRRLMQF